MRLFVPARLLRAALIAAGAWLTVKYLLPWTAPVVIALALAAMCEGSVSALEAAGWRRGIAAGLMTVTVVGALTAAVAFLVSRCAVALTELAAALPGFLDELVRVLSSAETAALSLVDSAPAALRGYMGAALDSVTDALYGLPAALAGALPSAAARLAAATPDVLLFTATAGIGLYFISASYPELTRFAARQLPPRLKRRLQGTFSDLRGAFGRYMRAQARLMLMTFVQLAAAFALLRVERPVAIAAVTSLVDALPVLGTGTVLIPWALWRILSGDAARGVGLLAVYAVVTVARSCLQPKLVGDELGLHPAVSLLAVYAGWRAFGVWGMLAFPLLAVCAKQLNDAGLVRLWKTGDSDGLAN